MSRVIVSTGSRLHFGLLSHAPEASRQFGGVGLMLEQPGFQLDVAAIGQLAGSNQSERDEFVGPGEWSPRILDVVQRCRTVNPLANEDPDRQYRWELKSSVPGHVGLGSGTQLGLAVARAWGALHGEVQPDPVTLAGRAGRGLRSALGIHGFFQGGFLVEAGKRTPGQISPVVARAEFPSDWRIVLICPPAVRGLSGQAEIAAFRKLPAMPEAMSAALCRIVLLELLPALHEADFSTCGQALFQFGWRIGEYFAPAQGGVFASARMAQLVNWLRARGIAGVGQSSWGPLLFALCSDSQMATALQSDLQNSEWGDCEIQVVAAKNAGAKVELIP